jgi:predicted lipid-binding transport protein (Tim44 family)
MTDETSKPASGTMPFSAEDAMAFMQKMWNPFALAMPGSTTPAPTEAPPAEASPAAANPAAPPFAPAFQAMMGSMMPGMMPFPNPAAMFAALDPVEIERKIGELRVIENWLSMSLNMTQMSMKTLELQHASLEAMRASHTPAKPSRDTT